jgi:hypothetical protein
MARHGIAWHGMAWHGMAWHGMAYRIVTVTSSVFTSAHEAIGSGVTFASPTAARARHTSLLSTLTSQWSLLQAKLGRVTLDVAPTPALQAMSDALAGRSLLSAVFCCLCVFMTVFMSLCLYVCVSVCLSYVVMLSCCHIV